MFPQSSFYLPRRLTPEGFSPTCQRPAAQSWRSIETAERKVEPSRQHSPENENLFLEAGTFKKKTICDAVDGACYDLKASQGKTFLLKRSMLIRR